ncbi:MAG: glycosyl hydrolase [Anaerolineae bacterium]|nr:glycosyl hydrolase [Anaerolineae bacterium]
MNEGLNPRTFCHPPKAYREVPFWSWNDVLDPQELTRQVALMDEAGWGGFFMHARVGLRTAYLGEQWMRCIRACVEVARERGMGAWLYDEDKWPSGFAGGLSVATNPAYRGRCLVCKVDNRPALIAERIATFAAREVDGELTDIRPTETPSLTDESDRVLQFYPLTFPLGVAWFNDYTYLDVLNAEAVRAFLESTHAVYAQAIGDEFGRAVPGIFTDEPQFRPHTDQMAIPWTDRFADIFQARRGYDLLPHLPALFFDVGDFHRVRYDYWRTITELFVESYSRQIFDWCEAHGLAYTGHYNAEDSLRSQIENVGAAMPHYLYMHIPGIDKLGREINARAGTVLTVKQLDSVVCQFGKPRALCENYGCGGQDFAHAGRKWIGDWSYVLGVNLNNPHLSLYSMRGERKRDYPQNLFYQQPWWPENRLIADHFARLSYVLSQGTRVVDILVIHPVASAWTLYCPRAPHAVDVLDRALDRLLMTLLQHQRDFHLGDEMLMETEAGCKMDDAGRPRLQVGKMEYRLVIVPPGVTLAARTVHLLHEFAAAGGPVLALEPLPYLIEGRPADSAVLPETARVVTLDTLPDVLDELLPFDVRVPGSTSIWAHHRQVGEADVYFLANTDLEWGGIATVQLRGTGYVEEWDTATGGVHPLPCCQREGITEVTLDFPPLGSHLLVLQRNRAPVTTVSPPARVIADIPLDDTWELIPGSPNALTLDTVQVRLGEDEWSVPMHILDAHAMVARAGVGVPFALRFVFDVAVRPGGPIHLVMESPERFAISVNGKSIPGTDAGWWTDISFRKIEIGTAIQGGRNEVVLRGTFVRDTELESVYLIGDFGVQGRRIKEENRFNGQAFDRYAPEFQLVELPACLRASGGTGGLALDLTARGFPFFAGRVTLRQRVKLPPLKGRTVLEIDRLRAAVANVRADGRHMGTIAWPPYRVELGSLSPGEHVIEIELVSTLRNLLGPHHLTGGDLAWTGPNQFRDKSRWTDDYILVPFGFDRATLALLEQGDM